MHHSIVDRALEVLPNALENGSPPGDQLQMVTCAMLTSLQAEVLAGILKRLLSGVGVSLKLPGVNQS